MYPKQKNLEHKLKLTKNQLENLVSGFSKLSIRKVKSDIGVSPTLVHNICHDTCISNQSSIDMIRLDMIRKIKFGVQFPSIKFLGHTTSKIP